MKWIMMRGFEWIDCHQEENCIYSFKRLSKTQTIIAVFNFSDRKHVYEMTINNVKKLELVLSSDEERFGGNSSYDSNLYKVKKGKVKIGIGSYTGMYFMIN